MITLKLKSYNRLELKAMERILSEALKNPPCGTESSVKPCKICEYRHICQDCWLALEYVQDRLYGQNTQNLPY